MTSRLSNVALLASVTTTPKRGGAAPLELREHPIAQPAERRRTALHLVLARAGEDDGRAGGVRKLGRDGQVEEAHQRTAVHALKHALKRMRLLAPTHLPPEKRTQLRVQRTEERSQ